MGRNAVPGEHIFLEPLSKEHISEYLHTFSPRIQEILRVNTICSERAYLEQRCENDAPFFYVIKDRETDQIIGAIEIRSSVFRSQLYCWLNEHWWGRGYFYEALKLALALYFIQSGNESVSARVDSDNVRSMRALQKIGFHSRGLVQGPRGKQYELLLSLHDVN